MTPRSPFIVIPEFISPLTCETLIDRLRFQQPTDTIHGETTSLVTKNSFNHKLILSAFESYIPEIEAYYNITYKSVSGDVTFHKHPEGCKTTQLLCDNSIFDKADWKRIKDFDFSCILFLVDYQNETPFDVEYEVYGGKLMFRTHGFGFNPQRGTLIIYPSGPNFANNVSDVLYGDLYYAKFHFTTDVPYVYVRQSFPGNSDSWFKTLL